MGKTVVYHPGKEDTPEPIIFNPIKKTVELCRSAHVRKSDIPEIEDPNTVYISDSHEPEIVKAWTATITSPRRERWHEKSKAIGSRVIYFSSFTWEEIQEFSRQCLAKDAPVLPYIISRFWGGNVRYVCMVDPNTETTSMQDALKK
jgi:hypothetical protein